MYITFNYHCESCGNTAERFVKRSEQDQQVCDCKGTLKKCLAATKTHFRFADKKLKR